jgi:hypothetical protein
MAESQDVYRKTNDVNFEYMKLRSGQGGAIDVSNLVLSVDLFEDIYSPFMTGTVTISDGIGLRSHLPIMGMESFDLSFRTPGVGADITNVSLSVVSISKREINRSGGTETYELKMRSPSYLTNEIARVKGSYSGKISDIVKKIMDDYYPGVPHLIQPTKNEYKFTIPNMKISEVMDMLCRHAVSEEGDPNYVFYETLSGFVFRSIGDMCKQDPVKQYNNKLSSINDGKDKSRQEFLKIQEFQVESDFDLESQLSNGALASRLITHDLTTKSIRYSSFNYVSTFDDYNHLNDNRKLPIASPLNNVNDGVNIFMPKSTLNHGDLFDNNQDYEEFVQGGISTRRMWLTDSLAIKVAGDSRLRVGNVAHLSMPATEPKKGANDESYEHKYSSGKYLITSIRHHLLNIGTKEYTNTIEMSRDSLPQAIPDNKKFENLDGEQEDRILTNG